MESITIRQIFEWVIFFSGEIGAIIGLVKLADNGFHKALQSELAPINRKLEELDHKRNLSDREHTKNYIVRFLVDVEQGELIDKDELHYLWDNYEL